MTQEERQKLREMWSERVVEFRSTDQSVAAWCREHEIKESRMRYWLRRLAPVETQPSARTTQWMSVAVAVQDEERAKTGVLVHAGRATIEVRSGFDPELLVDVIRTLTAPC